jgi:arabinan endo-1,5-alpha-L-arabinosidase
MTPPPTSRIPALTGCLSIGCFWLALAPVSGAGGFVDDFDGRALDGWSVGPEAAQRDDRHWSIDPRAGVLTILTQESDIHTGRNEPINYFLRETGLEDFEITTRVKFAPGEPYEHAGLVVWESADDYIKLVSLFAEGNRLEGAIEAGGRYSSQLIDHRAGEVLFLRIRKIGREYTYLFSVDGSEWEQLGSRVKASWVNPRVGFFAVSPGSGRRIPAEFSFFRVNPPEILQESGFALPGDSTPAKAGVGQVSVGYQNPVYLGDVPDPGIVRAGDAFYVVSTQAYLFNGDAGIPILKSRDLVNWRYVGSVFNDSNLPAWINPENRSLWAPDLIHREDTGRYYLYFSAMGDAGMGIGVGWAEHPEGPYTFQDEALVKGSQYRHIDSHTFQDTDDALYMYWGSHGGSIMVQALSEDGLSLVGERRDALLPQNSPVIIDADRGPSLQNENLVEAPWVVKRGDYYYLFYSGNAYYPNAYSVMVARAASPVGPFNKHGSNPILTTNDRFNAPGHNALIQDDAGQDWFVYHAYLQSHIGFGRALLIDRVDWVEGWPVINGGRGATHDWQENGPILTLGQEYQPMRNVALGKPVATSSAREGHPAINITDGDPFTRWSPGRIDEPQWLEIDLGSEYSISRTQVLFRSARGYISDPQRVYPGQGHIDQYYFYRIDHSRDGETWEVYADHAEESPVAYPYIDHGEVTARFLRLTVTGCKSDRPNKNVYQVQVFGAPLAGQESFTSSGE